MLIFSIEGRLEIFKEHSNISTNKYDILILPSTLFICSIPSLKVNTIAVLFIGVMAWSRNTENTRTFVKTSIVYPMSFANFCFQIKYLLLQTKKLLLLDILQNFTFIMKNVQLSMIKRWKKVFSNYNLLFFVICTLSLYIFHYVDHGIER